MLKKNLFLKINLLNFFFISLAICLLFYTLEGLFNIDRFYHPDSKDHYLNPKEMLPTFQKNYFNPFIFLNYGYHYFSKLLNHNYYLLIFSNFIFYSLTNLIIFEKVFKKFLKNKNLYIVVLFYLLFLEPYRLHLTCHVLKETLLIFILTTFIFVKSFLIKIFFFILLEFVRKNSIVYLLIFLSYNFIKKNILYVNKYLNNYSFKNKKIYINLLLLILIIIFFYNYSFVFEFAKSIFNKIYYLFRVYFFSDMQSRNYDNLTNFQEYGYHIGFWLKLLTWPLLYLSGFFLFFTTSILFKILGLIIIINHYLVYKLTKKTFITLGLFLIIIFISIFSTSYTAMYRYSYIGYYIALVYFFFNLNFNLRKN